MIMNGAEIVCYWQKNFECSQKNLHILQRPKSTLDIVCDKPLVIVKWKRASFFRKVLQGSHRVPAPGFKTVCLCVVIVGNDHISFGLVPRFHCLTFHDYLTVNCPDKSNFLTSHAKLIKLTLHVIMKRMCCSFDYAI